MPTERLWNTFIRINELSYSWSYTRYRLYSFQMFNRCLRGTTLVFFPQSQPIEQMVRLTWNNKFSLQNAFLYLVIYSHLNIPKEQFLLLFWLLVSSHKAFPMFFKKCFRAFFDCMPSRWFVVVHMMINMMAAVCDTWRFMRMRYAKSVYLRERAKTYSKRYLFHEISVISKNTREIYVLPR